jgi:TPR repeat protein
MMQQLPKTDEVDFSTRTQNVLRQMGIDDLQQLASQTERDLLRQPNLGKKSLNEIQATLADFGLTLGMVFAAPEAGLQATGKSREVLDYEGHVLAAIKRHLPFLEQASRVGYGSADNHLGVLYLEGKGVKQDFRRARVYFVRAARRGFKPGFWNLSLLYRIGYGVRRSLVKADRYQQMATV